MCCNINPLKLSGYYSIAKPISCTNVSNLFLFWNETLHVSDGLSVHHQEFKTVQILLSAC